MQFIPVHEDFVRVFYYINFYSVKETNDQFIFTGYSQLDMKMKIPQWIINITIPWKMADWYEMFLGYLFKLDKY